ncbi:type III secretion system translocon subunit SctE [Pseudomonas sp. 22526]|uniref:type III secretion system translocon subunit SctE n=1 Tax=Pseudomonas sp. 22526 TaxID=3453937 RepID=UPI003F847064
MSITLNPRPLTAPPTEQMLIPDNPKISAEAQTGANASRGPSTVFGDISQQHSRVNTPPPPKLQVSQLEAMKALERIFANVPAKNESGTPISLKDLEKIPMDSIMLASTLLSSEILGSTAMAKSKALAIMTDKQERVRQQEVADFREQMDKAIEQQEKAKKAGIFGVIFDWIIAAVEIVTGVAKIIGGALTGNVMTAAGGAMDLMAGLAGVVKAAANTMALIDPDNAEKYRAIADVAGKVQLGFEIAGAVIDITSAARNMLMTKVIPKVAGTVLKEGAEQALVAGIKAGSKSAIDQTAKMVGKEVASQVSAQIAQNLGKVAMEASKTAGKEAAQKIVQQLGVNRMLEKFSQEAIEQLVTNAVKKVGHGAIDKGVEMTAKEVTKAVTKEINREVLQVALKASTYTAVNVTRGAVAGASQITAGALAADRAKLQKEISQLILDQQWLQSLFTFYKDEKDAAMKRIGELVEGQSQVVQDGSKAIAQAGAVQVQIASAMV